MAVAIRIEEAQRDLSRLLARLRAGEEEVIIAESGTLVARLVSEPQSGGGVCPERLRDSLKYRAILTNHYQTICYTCFT